MATNFRSKLTVCTAQANPVFNTELLFDKNYKQSLDSPIDEFLNRLLALNKLAPKPAEFDAIQGQLVFLGIIAAVESFLRTLFRKIISMDASSQTKVYKQDVSFGAALHLSKELLPEAILERISFISKDSIESAMKDLLAVKGSLPSDLNAAISDYARVCQLRHCAVHRFGKLGAGNAISLGLENHKRLLEKPLNLDYVALQNVIAISTCLVKTINNFLFNEILSRVPASMWMGTYSKDRLVFMRHSALFCDKVSSHKTAQANLLYQLLMKQHKVWSSSQPH